MTRTIKTLKVILMVMLAAAFISCSSSVGDGDDYVTPPSTPTTPAPTRSLEAGKTYVIDDGWRATAVIPKGNSDAEISAYEWAAAKGKRILSIKKGEIPGFNIREYEYASRYSEAGMYPITAEVGLQISGYVLDCTDWCVRNNILTINWDIRSAALYLNIKYILEAKGIELVGDGDITTADVSTFTYVEAPVTEIDWAHINSYRNLMVDGKSIPINWE